MTASEQLSIWAALPDDELLLGITFDEKPYTVHHVRARDALAALERRSAEINDARVSELSGVTCIVFEGCVSNAAHSPYRAILSAAGAFR